MSRDNMDVAIAITGRILGMLGPVVKYFITEHNALKSMKSSGVRLSGNEWAANDAEFDTILGELEAFVGKEPETASETEDDFEVG